MMTSYYNANMIPYYNVKQMYIAFLAGSQKLYFKDGLLFCKGTRFGAHYDMPLSPPAFCTDSFYILYGIFKERIWYEFVN